MLFVSVDDAGCCKSEDDAIAAAEDTILVVPGAAGVTNADCIESDDPSVVADVAIGKVISVDAEFTLLAAGVPSVTQVNAFVLRVSTTAFVGSAATVVASGFDDNCLFLWHPLQHKAPPLERKRSWQSRQDRMVLTMVWNIVVVGDEH